MCTWVNEERCTMMKTCFSNAKQIKKFPKTTLCQECTYVQKYRIESDENFDIPPNNEPILSSSYLYEEPIFNVVTIKERLKEMNLHMVQKKETNYRLKNMTNIEQFNTKRGKQHSPISYPQL